MLTEHYKHQVSQLFCGRIDPTQQPPLSCHSRHAPSNPTIPTPACCSPKCYGSFYAPTCATPQVPTKDTKLIETNMRMLQLHSGDITGIRKCAAAAGSDYCWLATSRYDTSINTTEQLRRNPLTPYIEAHTQVHQCTMLATHSRQKNNYTNKIHLHRSRTSTKSTSREGRSRTVTATGTNTTPWKPRSKRDIAAQRQEHNLPLSGGW